MTRVLLFLVLATRALAVDSSWITLEPDGSDSIGIPQGVPYAGTCFARCNRVAGHQVKCDANQRFASAPGSIWTPALPADCAADCMADHLDDELVLPTNTSISGWRKATAQWCLYLQDPTTKATYYPASHCENYQMTTLRAHGPGDSECYYPDAPASGNFVYVDPLQPAASVAFLARTVLRRKPMAGKVVARPGKPGRLPWSYRVAE